jgi:hypothetical protein
MFEFGVSQIIYLWAHIICTLALIQLAVSLLSAEIERQYSTEVAAKSLCSGRGHQPLLAYVATLSPSNEPQHKQA